jgi:hypothetical protein
LIARLMPIGYNPHSLVVSRAAIQDKGLTDFDGLLLRIIGDLLRMKKAVAQSGVRIVAITSV